MKFIALVMPVLLLPASMVAASELNLGNDVWPPFVVDGEGTGTSEAIVCEALSRSGRVCTLELDEWSNVLERVESGDLDGVAAIWKTPERETVLLFSDAYLTNRIVPVTREAGTSIKSFADLKNMRVAVTAGYAYGDEFISARTGMSVIEVANDLASLEAVRSGRADVALVDELAAKALLDDDDTLYVLDTVLAFRELHFGIDRSHPEAQEVMADFHRGFDLMLRDGTVTKILNLDWLVTDLGNDGTLDLVMNKDVAIEDLSNPLTNTSSYALAQSDYFNLRKEDLEPEKLNFHVDGQGHSNLGSALNSAFGPDKSCGHVDWSSTFSCALPTRPR